MHIAQPLLREAFEAKAGTDGKGELLTAEEAEKLLDECMKVLFYRDARSINKVSHWFQAFTSCQLCAPFSRSSSSF
jgi:20S proteasome alpha/beta subunit